ncbi:hypothetical protein LXL04_009195 [Taraxacum kok-saghyz]
MILESRSFENSYIPENPRTPKPLTFSKNRLRGAKNRSNISPVAKNFFRKNDFFFPKNFAYVQTFFLCICAQFFVLFQNCSKTRNFFKFFYRSLYNTYLKSCTYAQKIKKSCTYAKVKKKYRFFGNFFQRIVMIKNVLEGSEVESRSFENSYIPENPRTPKPLTFSKNRLRGAKNRSNISPVAKKKFRKNDFFFPKTLHMCKLFFVHMSLYNTYLKRFVKKILKKKRKKKKNCIYAQKIKKSCTYVKVKKKYRFFGNFFQRIVMIKNVLEGSEVGFLKGITEVDQVRRMVSVHSFVSDLSLNWGSKPHSPSNEIPALCRSFSLSPSHTKPLSCESKHTKKPEHLTTGASRSLISPPACCFIRSHDGAGCFGENISCTILNFEFWDSSPTTCSIKCSRETLILLLVSFDFWGYYFGVSSGSTVATTRDFALIAGTFSIFKKGEWTVCSIHTIRRSIKRKKKVLTVIRSVDNTSKINISVD